MTTAEINNLDLGAMIDEYAKLDAQIAAVKPLATRQQQLREELLKIAVRTQGNKPEKTLSLGNARYTITWGPCENQRRIVDLAKVKKRLGFPLFMKLVALTLKNLDAHVTKAEQAELGLTITERTGPREVKLTTKAVPVVNQAS